jgi:hypothetical protein
MIRRIVEKSSTMRIFMFLSNSTSKQSLTRPAPGRAFNQYRHKPMARFAKTIKGVYDSTMDEHSGTGL